MSIRKRVWASGSQEKTAWIVDYADNGGKRRQATFRTKKEAERHWLKVSTELARGSHVLTSDSMTVAEVGNLWIQRAKAERLERSTYEEYDRVLDLHIIPRVGNVKLATLTKPFVEIFRDRLLSELPIKTASRVFGYFKIIMRVAEDKGLISSNVSTKVKMPSQKRHKKRPEYFTKNEINLCFAAAKKLSPRHSAFAHVFFFAGLRASEGRGLCWKAVDLAKGLLTVHQRADRWGTVGVPKSESGFRTIPLTPSCIAALGAWKRICDPGPDDLVFPARGGKPMTYFQLVSQLYDPMMFEAGLTKMHEGKTKHLRSLHSMRHTTASVWIEMGFSAKRVQVLMGHSSIQITFDLYGQLIDLAQSGADMMLKVDKWVLQDQAQLGAAA
jgi:integrase